MISLHVLGINHHTQEDINAKEYKINASNLHSIKNTSWEL
jgi:hypothetical protein